MEPQEVIRLNEVSETYRVEFKKGSSSRTENLLALRDINLSIKKGECVAVLGANGAGKSTLLKLISGLLVPDKGNVEVNGRVSSLLELGSTFEAELTGRENVFLLAGLYGLNEHDIEKKMEDILEFSGIGHFVDAPVRYYSTGMYVRLAFSLAIHIDPDIILIDDCLAVGDESFQKRCVEKILELKGQGKAIILVTHDTNLASLICKRGIFLRGGQLLHDGPIKNASLYYTQAAGDSNNIAFLQEKDLFVIFNNGKLFLNYKDLPLTKSIGCHAFFSFGDRRLCSKDANWRMQFCSPTKIRAMGKFAGIDAIQIWEVEVKDTRRISWNIEVDSRPDGPMKLEGFSAMLGEQYNRWHTLQDSGHFPPQFSSVNEWEEVGSEKKDLPGNVAFVAASELAGPGCNAAMPSVGFELVQNEHLVRCHKYNTGLNHSARVISIDPVSTWDKGQGVFKANILLFNSEKELKDHLDYRQRSLRKTHSLKKGPLELIYDQAKIRLYYEGQELTKEWGLFSSVYARGRWHHTYNAILESIQHRDPFLSLVFRWPDLPVHQIWQLELDRDSEHLSWKANTQLLEDFCPKSYQVGLYLDPVYKKWISTYEQGYFPEDFLGQGMPLNNSTCKEVLAEASIGLPAVMLDVSQDRNGNMPGIQNGNNLLQGRVLYSNPFFGQEKLPCQKGEYQIFYGILRIFPQPQQVQQYIAKCQQWREKEISKLRLTEVEANTIRLRQMRLSFEEGCFRLYFDEKEIFMGPGLRTMFDIVGKAPGYNSATARILVKKDSESQMGVFVSWDGIATSQIWKLALEKEGVLNWKVIMCQEEDSVIENERAEVFLHTKYRFWKTAYEEAWISTEDSAGGEKSTIGLSNNKSEYMYVEAEVETELPPAIFKIKQQRPSHICEMYLDKRKGLVLYFLKVRSDEDSSSGARCLSFETEIAIGEDRSGLVQISKESPPAIVLRHHKKVLELAFEEGAIKLFWKGLEITKALGFYTSLRCGQVWYDSTRAIWRVDVQESDTLKAVGFWPWVPVIQYWEVSITGPNQISFDIKMELARQIPIERQEANLMLTEKFWQFLINKKASRFQGEFSPDEVFWYRNWCGLAKDNIIGVSSGVFGKLPKLYFRTLKDIPGSRFVVENSSRKYQARLLQHVVMDTTSDGPKIGIHEFFKGIIQIG